MMWCMMHYEFALGPTKYLPFSTGKPTIKQLTEKASSDGNSKVLICEADGSPQPEVQWSINGTNVSLGTGGGLLLLLTRCRDM